MELDLFDAMTSMLMISMMALCVIMFAFILLGYIEHIYWLGLFTLALIVIFLGIHIIHAFIYPKEKSVDESPPVKKVVNKIVIGIVAIFHFNDGAR